MKCETGRNAAFSVGIVSTEERGRNYLDRSAGIPKSQSAIDVLIAESVRTCPIDVEADDQLLMLFTCVAEPDIS